MLKIKNILEYNKKRINKSFFKNNDSFLTILIFDFLVFFLNLNLFVNLFVFTYYITFYTVILDIFLILKNVYYFYSNNPYIKDILTKLIIVFLIILLCMPFPAILFYYKIYTQWMNKVIVFIFCLISLFILVFFYYYIKILFIIYLCFLSILVFIFILYYNDNNNNINIIIKKNNFIISFIISFILYCFNGFK